MKEKIREKLFGLLFPSIHAEMRLLIDNEHKLSQAIQKKEAKIQTLKSKIRRMERRTK